MSVSNSSVNCGYCGCIHYGQVCPRVKAMEYHPDGTLKRVEFHAPYTAPMIIGRYDPPITYTTVPGS